MPDDRLEVSVTFDERGYIGSAPELRQAVVALSLGLRRKIEIAMLPDDVRVVLQLDGLAEWERHRHPVRRLAWSVVVRHPLKPGRGCSK